jgi:hypothetical protein
MSSNRRGGSRKGTGRPNTKAKGTRKLSSYYESLHAPEEPPVLAPTATEVEVAATEKPAPEKAAKEKAATDRRERIQMELRETLSHREFKLWLPMPRKFSAFGKWFCHGEVGT